MLKSNLIAAIQFEIRRHNWTTYMQDGIVRPGCSTCLHDAPDISLRRLHSARAFSS
jgi:hypothetical protein